MMFDNHHGMWNFMIFGIIIMVILASYVASDAAKFGENGMLWALIVFFMPMMGLLFYLLIRSTWSDKSRTWNQPYATNNSSIPPNREMIRPRQQTQREGAVDTKSGSVNIQKDTFYCTSCGKQNMNTASYCNSCGAQIQIME